MKEEGASGLRFCIRHVRNCISNIWILSHRSHLLPASRCGVQDSSRKYLLFSDPRSRSQVFTLICVLFFGRMFSVLNF